ncbi:MAG: hypothetical protein B7Z78_10775 [Rhodospirillales bacterium 20-60-12]|nr:MAG: hypothetical protein B7Z78_10775 [Rhodospirillales bacterium 20-60-12]HQT68334.1 sulfurtransferase [Acetobacteraceae bacterium]
MKSAAGKAVLTASLLLSISPLAARAAAAAAPALVTPAYVQAHMGQKNTVIIEVYDTDKQKSVYDQGHLPNAQFTGFLDDGWRTVGGAHPFMLPPTADIAAVVGRYGINNQTRVYLVPAGPVKGDFKATARIYWTLRYVGDNNVSIMNGGDRAWAADPSRKMSTAAPVVATATFTPHVTPGYLATTKDVRAALASSDIQLVDARPVAQYEGLKMAPVDAAAGTLQGAISLPFSTLLTPDGEGMKSKAEITAELKKAGVDPMGKGITFCNTGHLASNDWFALREVVGNPNVRLYAGSMATWTHEGLPVVPGKTPG